MILTGSPSAASCEQSLLATSISASFSIASRLPFCVQPISSSNSFAICGKRSWLSRVKRLSNPGVLSQTRTSPSHLPEVPAVIAPFSTRITSIFLRTRKYAIAVPTTPPPMTTTSAVLVVFILSPEKALSDCYLKNGFYFILVFFDRIDRIFRIFFPGFPDESLETTIAFGDK